MDFHLMKLKQYTLQMTLKDILSSPIAIFSLYI